MSRTKKGISERAVERLEEKGYLMSIRAEMKAEVMKCLVEMEEQGEIPRHLRIKRYTPPDEENKLAIAYIAEFMRHHSLTSSLQCLQAEVNGDIAQIEAAQGGKMSRLGEILMSTSEGNALFD